jgi:adenylate cyclase
VDGKCQMLVNHYGNFNPRNIAMNTFVNIVNVFFDFYDGKKTDFDTKKLKDKIVFLGLTATGTSDLRPTPFSTTFPMVGFQAMAASNIIEGDFLRASPGILNYLIILLAGLIASAITIRFRAIHSALINTLFILLYFGLSFVFFRKEIVITTFYPFMSVVLSYMSITIHRFTSEEKEKKVIRNMFQRYVSSQIVDVLLAHPESLNLGGERKRLTIFFSDVRGFTTMSEKMQPEEVVHILNEYLTEMTDIVFKYTGTLDKFIGDAIMVIWGAPVPQENHAELAVRAALEMKHRLKELQDKWEKEGKKKVSVGMGINTGDVVVGNMGSVQFADYTVIGDNVNLAARLEENASAGQLIISETTYEEVKDIVEVSKLSPLKVKGKEKSVHVYEVLGFKS